MYDMLWNSMCHFPESGRHWLPLDKLDETVTEGNVRTEILRVLPDLAQRNTLLDLCVTLICKSHVDSTINQQNVTSCRKVFAILVMMGKTNCIIKFIIQSGLRDIDLPLQQVIGPTRKPQMFKGDSSQALSCFEDWEPYWQDSFRNTQWKLLEPFFSCADATHMAQERVLFYPLEDGIGLPFTFDNQNCPAGYLSGFGVVWKVKIHKAHHNFADDKASA